MTDQATLPQPEAAILATAAQIVENFDREQIPLNVALGICGTVLNLLLDRASPSLRTNFLAALARRHSA